MIDNNNQNCISVIIPVYNVEKYLNRCVESVINQTYKNLQIILVDDGSSDSSPDICDKYVQTDSRILVVHKTNGGVSSARNVGLNKATGKYVTFIDSDDWVHPQFLETLYTFINQGNFQLCSIDFETKFNQSTFFDFLDIPSINAVCYYGIELIENSNVFRYVCGKLYLRQILENLKFNENIKLSEDALFNTTLFAKQNINAICLDQKLYYYFQRPDSAVHSIQTDEIVKVAESYFNLANTASNVKIRSAIFINSIKSFLLSRYSAKILKNKNVFFVSKSNLKSCNKILLRDRNISLIKKIKYFILIQSPAIYRIFRILTDPTMLDWEKSAKNQNKNKVKIYKK